MSVGLATFRSNWALCATIYKDITTLLSSANHISWLSTSSLVSFLLFFFPPYIGSVVAMYSSSVPTACGPEFHDHPYFPVSPYVCEYVKFLDSWRFSDMHKSEVALTIRDHNNIGQVTSVGAGSSDGSIVRVQICPSHVTPAPTR